MIVRSTAFVVCKVKIMADFKISDNFQFDFHAWCMLAFGKQNIFCIRMISVNQNDMKLSIVQ